MAIRSSKSLSKIQDGVDHLIPFTAASMSGHRRLVGLGQLPEPYRSQYQAAGEAGSIVYTVCSYYTPIGWFAAEEGGWVVPQARYSVTTSGHQGLLMAALAGTLRAPSSSPPVSTVEVYGVMEQAHANAAADQATAGLYAAERAARPTQPAAGCNRRSDSLKALALMTPRSALDSLDPWPADGLGWRRSIDADD